MKIAHINMLHNGSTGNIMINISKAAESRGHICRTYSPVIYARGRNVKIPDIHHHCTWGSRRENFLHYYIGTALGINGALSRKGTRELIRYLNEFQPDIIHLHNLHNFTVNLPLLFNYLKKKNIKVVWTLHDCWAFTGHCPYFDIVKCEKWKTGCYKCPQKKIYPKTYIDTTNWAYKWKKRTFLGINNLTIVTPSKWLAELVKQSFLCDYPIKVIHNGIDLSVFHPEKSTIRDQYNCRDKKLILGVAFEWGKRKGLDVFIDLAKRLDDGYRIILVGTNETVDSCLSDNMISIHRTENQRELAEFYSAADLFLNPTREDNFPTVNMEALACGTPVLTFRTGGSPEMIDSTCGIVVDCDDIDGMYNALRKLCEEETFKADACVRKARTFDMHQKFSEYIDLYECL